MDPATWMAIIGLIGGVLSKIHSNQNQNGIPVRSPLGTNLSGEFDDIGGMLRDLYAKALTNQQQGADKYMQNVGVPELPDGRGRKIPRYLQPPGDPRRLAPFGEAGMHKGGTAWPAPNQDTSPGPPTPPPPVPAPPPNQQQSQSQTQDQGQPPTPSAPGDSGQLMQMLEQILNPSGTPSSPSRISPGIADAAGGNGQTKSSISPQTYGAAMTMVHALSGDPSSLSPFEQLVRGNQQNQSTRMFA